MSVAVGTDQRARSPGIEEKIKSLPAQAPPPKAAAAGSTAARHSANAPAVISPRHSNLKTDQQKKIASSPPNTIRDRQRQHGFCRPDRETGIR